MIKKGYFLIFLVLSCLVSVCAQSETPFEATEEAIIAPPPPPEEEKEIIGKLDVIFELKDYDLKNLISDIHVNLEILDKETGEKTNTLKYVGNDGLVKLRLYKGTYDITLKVDKIDTGGRDYFITVDQDVDNDVTRTAYLFSVGSVIGNVYGGNGKAVKGAQIKFECSGDYGDRDNKISDDFGGFSSYWLPIGSCRVCAMHGYKVGFMDVEIKKGELSNIDVTLNKGIISGFNFWTILIMIVVLIVAFFGVRYISKKGKEEVEKKEEIEEKKEVVKEDAKEKLSSRTRDIINTLKEKEESIVNFLLENNNKSTQAKIRYSTGIPKTSLVRILLALELKKVVKIEKIGKLKKVGLTSWFLGKE